MVKKVYESIQRKSVSKIFFNGVFLSIYSHLVKKFELFKLCRKKVMGLKKPENRLSKVTLSYMRHIFFISVEK